MKTNRKQIKIIIEKTETGFSAYSKDYSIYTTGKNIAELQNNALEATQLFFQNKKVDITISDLKFEYDFQQFFQYYRVINAKALAEKIGMNVTLLSQYVSGKKKPSNAQTEKILMGIHKIGEELSELNLIYR